MQESLARYRAARALLLTLARSAAAPPKVSLFLYQPLMLLVQQLLSSSSTAFSQGVIRLDRFTRRSVQNSHSP